MIISFTVPSDIFSAHNDTVQYIIDSTTSLYNYDIIQYIIQW